MQPPDADRRLRWLQQMVRDQRWVSQMHLTAEEQRLVDHEGYLCILGRSGTGKTVIQISRAVRVARSFEAAAAASASAFFLSSSASFFFFSAAVEDFAPRALHQRLGGPRSSWWRGLYGCAHS